MPGRQLPNALAACPTSVTALTADKALFFELSLFNTNAADRTVTFTDGNDVSMGPWVIQGTTATGGSAGTFVFGSDNGIEMTAGIKISASGSGVNYSLFAFAETLAG